MLPRCAPLPNPFWVASSRCSGAVAWTVATRADLAWWHSLLSSWPGISTHQFLVLGQPDRHLYTDASGSWGCGAWSLPAWLQVHWPTGHCLSSIALKELVPVVLAAAVWAERWRGQLILCHSDNTAVVAQLNSLHAHDPLACNMLRCLAFLQALHDFSLRAVHIAGTLNTGLTSCLATTRLPFWVVIHVHPPHRHRCARSWFNFSAWSRQIGHRFTGGIASPVFGAGLIRFHQAGVPGWLEPLPLLHKDFFPPCHLLAVSTIESYLAALRHFRVVTDPHCILPTFHSPYMKILLRGIRRVQGQQAPARVQLPITASLMCRIKAQLSLPPASYLKVLIWAACSIGFFGFLRAGEFLVPNGAQYDPSMHLSLSDINLVTSAPQWHFLVTIKASQTDQFFQGAQVVLGATGSDLCPVEALLDYLSSGGPAPGPLFILPDGGPLRRPQFVEEVQQALSASGLVVLNFNSHSFRIRAATSAGAAGVPESTIKVLGHWKSMAYQRYIQPSTEDLAQVSSQLC